MTTLQSIPLVVLLALTSCSYDPEELGVLESPIVNGVADTGHPAVGMLTTPDSWISGGICTATLVGTRTVLTAAHCVVKEMAPPFSVIPKLGWTPDGGKTIIAAASVVFHKDFTFVPARNDVAVVRLSQTVTNITPALVATTAPKQGEPVTLVGYGYAKDGADDTFGTRRKGQNTIGKVTATEIVFYGATGSLGNSCDGDGGGPTFAMRNGEEVLIGIHSWGEGACGVAEHDARADVHHGWIEQQAQGNLFEKSAATDTSKPDDSTPMVKILFPRADAQINANVQVAVGARDDVAVDRVELYLDGKLHETAKDALPCSSVQCATNLNLKPYAFKVTGLAPGPHNLRAEAVDTAGRRASDLISVTVADRSTNGLPPPASLPPTEPEGDFASACSATPGRPGAPPVWPALLLLGLRVRRLNR